MVCSEVIHTFKWKPDIQRRSAPLGPAACFCSIAPGKPFGGVGVRWGGPSPDTANLTPPNSGVSRWYNSDLPGSDSAPTSAPCHGMPAPCHIAPVPCHFVPLSARTLGRPEGEGAGFKRCRNGAPRERICRERICICISAAVLLPVAPLRGSWGTLPCVVGMLPVGTVPALCRIGTVPVSIGAGSVPSTPVPMP